METENYDGFPVIGEVDFDTELVSTVFLDLKCGKANDIDGLSAEHLIYSHPILSVILSKMFRLIAYYRLIRFRPNSKIVIW